MTKRKHADVAIHWFKGGQIEFVPYKGEPDDSARWSLWESGTAPSFLECQSYRIHDPYRALKKRQKEGAVIQWRYKPDPSLWRDCGEPLWADDYEYREKPQPPAKRKIDWFKMPMDTLCAIHRSADQFRYFSGTCDPDGTPLFFENGYTSKTESNSGRYFQGGALTLLPQDWKPWFGGSCPVPEGVEFEFMRRDGKVLPCEKANNWMHLEGASTDIIAYRILGVAEGWEE